MKGFATLCFVGVLHLCSVESAVPSFVELNSLTPLQRDTLQNFKRSVSPIVPDFMQEDIYLVKWLQATQFNARKSEQMIREALKWRADQQVSKWEEPSFFGEFEKDYPIFVDGSDREGRPIVEGFFGDWNVRAVAVSGKIKKLTNYCGRGIERANRKIRDLQGQGKNVTQWILLVNMDGFNLINQACPTCLPFYLSYVGNYEKYWPNTIFRTFLLNTPESFEFILNLIKPIMSPATRAALKIYGTNKAEWKPVIDELIDPKQVSDWYDPAGKERKAPA